MGLHAGEVEQLNRDFNEIRMRGLLKEWRSTKETIHRHRPRFSGAITL
jgi:hypothetical protein